VAPQDLRRGQVNFRSYNSCLSLGAPSPGRRRACVLFGIFFRRGYSPTGLPGDTVWRALPPTGWGGLSVLTHPGVTTTWPVAARCPCRRGRYRPRFKGTLSLLRKEKFEISASYQLAPWQTPVPTRAVVETGAEPSVIRADMLPEGWTEYASRAPLRTQVSDASGQLPKVNAEVSLTIYVGGCAMDYEFLVVKALSVPLILGWDFRRNYVDTIYLKTQTIKWDDGTSTVAMCSWMKNTRPAPPRRGNNPKAQDGAIRLRQGVTVGPRCIQAVQVCCNVKGVHLVRERPVKMIRRKVLLQNAGAEFSPNTPRSLYLTNIGDVPVHLTKGCIIGTSTAYNGPLHVVEEEEEPGAVLTKGRIPVKCPTRRSRRGGKPKRVSTRDNLRPTRRTRRVPSRRSTGRVSLVRSAVPWTIASRNTRRYGRDNSARSKSPRTGSR